MKTNKKIGFLFAVAFSIFSLHSLVNQPINQVRAEEEWEKIDSTALANNCLVMYDASDGYMYFKINPNDMPSDHVYVGNTPYYKTSDYNFLSNILLSNDDENYIPFSTIYFDIDFNFFSGDGFRLGIRRNAETIKEDGKYKYVKILEGCEFPSYDYCLNGGTKKKYVQQTTTISELTSFADGGTYSYAVYSEKVIKPTKTFNGIAPGWNDFVYEPDINYHQLILRFGEHEVDYLANDKQPNNLNRATAEYDVGNKLTINGLPIHKIYDKTNKTHVGYDHGYEYLYIIYPVEVLMMNVNNIVPTLHIDEGTEFMDVLLPEVNLKYSGGAWISVNTNEYTIDNPIDLLSYSVVEGFPHQFGVNPHAVLGNLPKEGAQIAFTINTGDIDLNDGSKVVILEGLYNTRVVINPAYGTIQLISISNGEELGIFSGFVFLANYNYSFEFNIVYDTKVSFSLGINHLLIFNCSFDATIESDQALWVVDTTGQFVMDLYEEPLPTYVPTIDYGGSSSYDFVAGDPLYNFVNVVNAFNLYDDNVSFSDLEFIYEDGAVTNGKYNEGIWTLTIKLALEGYPVVTKEITINVHGDTSIAKIYFDDNEPIEVPVGSKLIAPPNPETYREGDYDYVFEGWYFEGAKWDFENDVVEGDMHLESRFIKTELHFLVTVNYEGIDRISDSFSIVNGTEVPFEIFALNGATFEVYVDGQIVDSIVINEDVTITVKYHVFYMYIEPKAATCEEDGNVGYWYSPVYEGYYFGDSEGKEIIEDAIIPMLHHNIVHLDYKDSTCHDEGNIDCYYCTNCGTHYSDPDGEFEIENWAIPKKPHILTYHESNEATCEQDGNVEYWTCENEPGIYYGNDECTVVLEKVVIEALDHDYHNPTYTWNKTNDGYECTATLTCSRCQNLISETQVAEKTVIKEATCLEEGIISYSVRFNDERFNSQTKIINVPKIDHKYVFVERVEPTEYRDGVKEHYECSDCHECFIKNGDTYEKIEYEDLLIKYEPKPSSSGCGGSVVSASTIISISAIVLAVLLMLRRKEEKYEK